MDPLRFSLEMAATLVRSEVELDHVKAGLKISPPAMARVSFLRISSTGQYNDENVRLGSLSRTA